VAAEDQHHHLAAVVAEFESLAVEVVAFDIRGRLAEAQVAQGEDAYFPPPRR
jgi:hypothetical protein